MLSNKKPGPGCAPCWPKDMKTTKIETPEDSIRLPALVCLVGRRGGGNSSAFNHLMKQFNKDDLADRIFIISPTAFSPAVEAMFKDLGVDYEKDLHEDMTNASLLKVKAAVDEEGAQWIKDQDTQVKYKKLVSLLKGRTPIDHIDAELLTTAKNEGWFDQAPQAALRAQAPAALPHRRRPGQPAVRAQLHLLPG